MIAVVFLVVFLNNIGRAAVVVMVCSYNGLDSKWLLLLLQRGNAGAGALSYRNVDHYLRIEVVRWNIGAVLHSIHPRLE